MKNECYFCGSTKNIKIINLINHENKERQPICHVCFNQARICNEGLSFQGQTILLDLPRERIRYFDKKDGMMHNV